MNATTRIVTLAPQDYAAALFDLDGVLTRTASVHAAAWKKLFDDFLARHAAQTRGTFVPFDVDSDYRRYVDGKPRYDGVASFLESRGIVLPPGEDGDEPGELTMHALGSLKDRYFMEHLHEHGVGVYEAAIALVRTLRSEDIRTAVVSSSVNCEVVLEAAGISHLFDVRVDGVDMARLALKGKPAPDAFLEAARRLEIPPSRSLVVEDAIAGVQAAHAGDFALVIGVDHGGRSQALREAGAEVVVSDLGHVQVAAEPPSAWALTYEEFDPAREGVREALCALGNGYIETRGCAAWAHADEIHYPGTYLAGGYNRLETNVAGRVVENEDLVNLPNWLALEFRIGDGEWFDEQAVTLLSYRQELDLRRGLLSRNIRFEDKQGRRSTLRERRLVSMSDMHASAIELTLTPENWSGRVTVRSTIDGRVVNAGAQLYRRFNNRHLESLGAEVFDDDCVLLRTRTNQSDIRIAQVARTRAFLEGEPLATSRRTIDELSRIGQEFETEVGQGRSLAIEKLAWLYTSRDPAVSECGLAARKAASRAGGFQALLEDHVFAWKQLWRRFDVRLQPAEAPFKLNVSMLLRLNMLHLLQAASPRSIGLDIGVPARGWTGEAYQGHIFWDELFIFPFLNYRTPEITRSLLMYRHRRLDEARAAARAAGLRGAMFPWQSGSDGQEETQALNLNPHSLRWIPDNSYLQRHVGSAVAWNAWQYFQVTNDVEFMQYYGAELILEVARFWSSIASLDEARQRYDIRGVIGPDEFHEAYPDASKPGLDNNAYTNVMAVWVLRRALEVLELLPDVRSAELKRRLDLPREEIARWEDISRRMFVPFHDDGIISQFEGYEKLLEVDWQSYRARYGNIQRLELLLEAEGDSANRYKVSKQADVLMLFYLFSAEELTSLLESLGYRFDPAVIPRNVAYYVSRSSHGSTLSRVVHAWVLARSDRASAMTYFAEALQSDVNDIQQGTTAEGVHLGAMAGTVDLVQRALTGIEATGETLRLNPELPPDLVRFDMRIRYRGHTLDLRLTRDTLTVHGREPGVAPIHFAFRGSVCEFLGGSTRTFQLGGADRT